MLTRSAESFCAVFDLLYPQVRRYFLARGVEPMTAEELAQNVMFTVYRRVGDLRERELFFGWLFKVARNEMLQHERQRQRRGKIAEFQPLDRELADRMTTEVDSPLNLRFHEWMTHLEPAEREIIMLRFIDELSYEDLAVALAIPLGTVKWRIFNAKKKLAQFIAPGSGIN
jgi:RNA polymerase sigma factor (sigma-70 family)